MAFDGHRLAPESETRGTTLVICLNGSSLVTLTRSSSVRYGDVSSLDCHCRHLWDSVICRDRRIQSQTETRVFARFLWNEPIGSDNNVLKYHSWSVQRRPGLNECSSTCSCCVPLHWNSNDDLKSSRDQLSARHALLLTKVIIPFTSSLL